MSAYCFIYMGRNLLLNLGSMIFQVQTIRCMIKTNNNEVHSWLHKMNKLFELKTKPEIHSKHYQYLNRRQEFYFRIEEKLFFFAKIKSLHCIKRSFIPCLHCGERKIFIIWYKPFFKVDKGKMIIQIRYRNFDSSWFCTKEIFAGVYVENFVPIQKRLCLSNLQDKVHWGMQFNLNQCHPMVY